MLDIASNGSVKMNRGDTFSVPLFINSGTALNPSRFYIKNHPSTKVYLALMQPNQRFENALIRKTYTSESEVNENGDLIISFDSKDTELLHTGRYYYQVKIAKDGIKQVDTVIPKTEFYIV